MLTTYARVIYNDGTSISFPASITTASHYLLLTNSFKSHTINFRDIHYYIIRDIMDSDSDYSTIYDSTWASALTKKTRNSILSEAGIARSFTREGPSQELQDKVAAINQYLTELKALKDSLKSK